MAAPLLAVRPADIVASTWSTLKLDGFCRGGKSLNVSTNCATSACAGTTRNARWNAQS